MPGSTPNMSLPYGLLTDAADIEAFGVKPLALALDTLLGAPTHRGKSIIATTESRTNTAYGTLTTPDQVTGIVLPTDGLIAITYQATFQQSVGNAGFAAIFIGSSQLKVDAGGASPVLQEADPGTGGTVAGSDFSLCTGPVGLVSSGGAGWTGDVATGQAIGGSGVGGACYVFAAAGTYTVSVQFKASSGSVTAKNRKLRVWTLGF